MLDEHFLQAKWPMWELGIIMGALLDPGQSQPSAAALAGPPARAVLPVVLMDFGAIVATYKKHWTPAVIQAASSEGATPATLADLQRLLTWQGIRQNQVQAEAVGSCDCAGHCSNDMQH